MREILFRGKKVDDGEWIEGGFHQHFWDSGESAFIYGEDNYANCVIPETVGQYTGITDKNGKRIFEGDILKNFKCFGSTSGVVVFNEGGFEIKGLTPNSPETICYGFWQVKPNIEVVGNIHDNGELLEEKE